MSHPITADDIAELVGATFGPVAGQLTLWGVEVDAATDAAYAAGFEAGGEDLDAAVEIMTGCKRCRTKWGAHNA